MADLFWHRCGHEFLVQQQERKKWTKTRCNMQKNEIVLIGRQWPEMSLLSCFLMWTRNNNNSIEEMFDVSGNFNSLATHCPMNLWCYVIKSQQSILTPLFCNPSSSYFLLSEWLCNNQIRTLIAIRLNQLTLIVAKTEKCQNYILFDYIYRKIV